MRCYGGVHIVFMVDFAELGLRVRLVRCGVICSGVACYGGEFMQLFLGCVRWCGLSLFGFGFGCCHPRAWGGGMDTADKF